MHGIVVYSQNLDDVSLYKVSKSPTIVVQYNVHVYCNMLNKVNAYRYVAIANLV